jgi:hypothetical protein
MANKSQKIRVRIISLGEKLRAVWRTARVLTVRARAHD